jgi:hypothetical protein
MQIPRTSRRSAAIITNVANAGIARQPVSCSPVLQDARHARCRCSRAASALTAFFLNPALCTSSTREDAAVSARRAALSRIPRDARHSGAFTAGLRGRRTRIRTLFELLLIKGGWEWPDNARCLHRYQAFLHARARNLWAGGSLAVAQFQIKLKFDWINPCSLQNCPIRLPLRSYCLTQRARSAALYRRRWRFVVCSFIGSGLLS